MGTIYFYCCHDRLTGGSDALELYELRSLRKIYLKSYIYVIRYWTVSFDVQNTATVRDASIPGGGAPPPVVGGAAGWDFSECYRANSHPLCKGKPGTQRRNPGSDASGWVVLWRLAMLTRCINRTACLKRQKMIFPQVFQNVIFWSWEVGIVRHANICFWIIERKNQPFQKWQDYLKFCSHQAAGTAEKRNGWAGSCSLDCCHCPRECDCRWNVPGFGRVLRTPVIAMPELWRSNYYHLKRRVGFHPKGRNSDHYPRERASLMAQMVMQGLPVIQEIQIQSLGQENPLEKGMATHPSILAWRIPWTEEPGRLQFIGSQKTGLNWVTNTYPRGGGVWVWTRLEGFFTFFSGNWVGLGLWSVGSPMEPRPGCKDWIWAWNPKSIQP